MLYSYGPGGSDVDQGSSPIPIADPEQLTYQLTGLSMYCLYEAWIEPYDSMGQTLGESNRVPFLPSDIVHRFPLGLAG